MRKQIQITVTKETLEEMNKLKAILFNKLGFKLTNGNVISYLIRNLKEKSDVK